MTDKKSPAAGIGPYEILEELSKSSRSRVYKAVLPPSDHPVVVKVLPTSAAEDPDQVAKFHQEVGALREINDSNVALILDSGQDAESLFLVMEFVPLTALSRVLRRRRLSLAEAMKVFKNICLGLRAVHDKKIVHRNLNPTSILVSDELSMVKVAGFGSRADRTTRASDMETMATGRLNVAIHYVAPEQARGGEATQRGDIYSVGVILYEMLTGRLPMGRVGLPSRVNADLPAEVDQLVLDCLASEPDDRFASVDQVLRAVQRLEDKLRLGVVNEFTGLVRGTGKVVRHRGVIVALAATVVIGALGLGGYWLLTRGGGGDGPRADAANALRVEATDTSAGPVGVPLAVPPPPSADLLADEPVATISAAQPAAQVDDPAPATEADTAPTTAVVENAVREDLAVAREKVAAGLPEAALADLDELLAAHPNSPEALDAYLLKAQIHRGQQQTEAAKAALVEARSRFKSDPRTAEAVFQLAELTATGKGSSDREQARSLYTDVSSDYPGSEWAPKALAARARLEDADNLKVTDSELDRKVPLALQTRRELVSRYPRSRYSEEALWSLGETYRDLKVFDLAVQMYSALGERFPDTRRDTWWEAAQLYDKRLDDDVAAAEAYARVPESSTHSEAARKRLKKLSKN